MRHFLDSGQVLTLIGAIAVKILRKMLAGASSA